MLADYASFLAALILCLGGVAVTLLMAARERQRRKSNRSHPTARLAQSARE